MWSWYDFPDLLRFANRDRRMRIWLHIDWFSIVDGTDQRRGQDRDLTSR